MSSVRCARASMGPSLTAGDVGYDQARTTYFALRDGRPIAVVRPKHADDVAATVDVARRTHVLCSCRSGGHSGAAHSTGNGLLLDLGSLQGARGGRSQPHAWAETGLTAGEVAQALASHGLAVGFGDTGTVGIGGITLGGGVGFLSRLHGMTIDNVLAAEIVTADGQVTRHRRTSTSPTCSGRYAVAAGTSASSPGSATTGSTSRRFTAGCSLLPAPRAPSTGWHAPAHGRGRVERDREHHAGAAHRPHPRRAAWSARHRGSRLSRRPPGRGRECPSSVA